MPELPEVETTVRGLQKEVVGLKIRDVWTDLATGDKRKADTVANTEFFTLFKKEVLGKKIKSVERRAKNILINLNNGQTILIHMKMTGHLLYGSFKLKNKIWVPNEHAQSPLHDPFNRFIHFVLVFQNGKHLAFSDMRKFGKITLLDTATAHDTKHLAGMGPEILEKSFTLGTLKVALTKKPRGKIKTVLMDQSVLAGIGNIYSDEILWRSSIHPERPASKIIEREMKLMFTAMKELLKKGIDFGGDSMSDYRNIYGLPGKFQTKHEAYRRTGERCRKAGCSGVILRRVINGRSAHFCSKHQK